MRAALNITGQKLERSALQRSAVFAVRLVISAPHWSGAT